MTSYSARELLRHVDVVEATGCLGRAVRQLRYDSRRVSPGDLFVAIKGKGCDGHVFLSQAYERGAQVAVGQGPFDPPAGLGYVRVSDSQRALSQLAAAFYDYPFQRLFTVGVTGTKGKTSVSHLCAALFDDAVCLSTIVNPSYGFSNTTPPAPELQRLASEALAAGKRSIVLEISAHGLVQHRVSDVKVDVAVFTNLSQDHFDDFSGFGDYFQAKAALFTRLHPQVAVINADDAYGQRLIRQTAAPVTYGLSPRSAVRARNVRLNPRGSTLDVDTPAGSFTLQSALPGQFNVYNLLAATTVGVCAGVPVDRIRLRLESVRALPGRFERLRTPEGVEVVVDFAHSPDSLEQMIRFLKDHYPRVLTVFGCGGESDPFKRPLMGQISGTWSDHTLLTHDNPKHEDPQTILSQIEQGLRMVSASYEVIPERDHAIRHALQRARAGDCVLVAGKGHETTQIFADRVVPFNDADYLKTHCGAIAC